MTASQFSVTWDEYKNDICSGLGILQQNGEFVDMTLAADGYMVKVHQIVLALGSSYFKELIKSAACPHPVIFLNNISYEVLSWLLQYMYSGEVNVPSNKLGPFLEATKALHIKGLENINDQTNVPQIEENNVILRKKVTRGNSERSLKNTSDNSWYSVKNCQSSVDNTHAHSFNNCTKNDPIAVDSRNDTDFRSFGSTLMQEQTQDESGNITTSNDGVEVQYTVSERGCLQLILNRYLYNLHHTSSGGRIRRWRCINYRMKKCTAFVDTDGDIVVVRKNVHQHPFHDNKILKKVQNKSVFTGMNIALEHSSTKRNNEVKSDLNLTNDELSDKAMDI